MKEEQFPLLIVEIEKTQGIINTTQNTSAKHQFPNWTASYTDVCIFHNNLSTHSQNIVKY